MSSPRRGTADDDPDIVTTPPLAGAAPTCGADAAPDPPWSAWRTYVFERDEEPR